MNKKIILFSLALTLLLSMPVVAENSVELDKVKLKEELKSPANRVRAYSKLALIAKQEGRIDKAVTYYQKALQLNSDSAANHISLGDLYLKQNKYHQAIEEYSIAQNLTSHFIPKQKLGLIHYKLKNYNKASSYLKEIEENDNGTYISYYYLAAAKRKLGDIRTAINYYQQALELNPTYVKAYLGLGDAYLGNGQNLLALNSYKHAIEVNPNYYLSRFKLAYAYIILNRLEAAKKSLRNTLHLKSDFNKAREILTELENME